MTHRLELPDSVYFALEKVASATGTTPVGWIASKLGNESPPSLPAGARTAADLFAGRLGRVHSGGDGTLSENCGERFAEHLQQRRLEGRL